MLAVTLPGPNSLHFTFRFSLVVNWEMLTHWLVASLGRNVTQEALTRTQKTLNQVGLVTY